MKINITVGAKQPLSGYINVDPITKFDGLAVDIRDLDPVVNDAECTELIAVDVLDYLKKQDAISVVQSWIKKLRHNGKIVIGITDAYEVCKLFYQQRISLDDFNYLLHGALSDAWDIKLNHMTMEIIEELMKSNGLKITKRRLDDYTSIVEGVRP